MVFVVVLAAASADDAGQVVRAPVEAIAVCEPPPVADALDAEAAAFGADSLSRCLTGE